MKRRNDPITIKELKWDADKITRIETRLQPRYVNHMIYHRKDQGALEHQLTRFPYGTHDDIIDALQGVIQLLRNPKQKREAPAKDNEFEWWRKRAIQKSNTERKPFQFGRKTKQSVLPAQITYR